jgi:hypothetical protein
MSITTPHIGIFGIAHINKNNSLSLVIINKYNTKEIPNQLKNTKLNIFLAFIDVELVFFMSIPIKYLFLDN